MRDQQRAAEQLFEDALDLRPEERQAFLDRACQGQPELRIRVEALLQEDDRLQGFLAHPPLHRGEKQPGREESADIADVLDAQIASGAELGPYRIEQMLGQGGMGRVYRAWDSRLDRPVAIKLCKRAFLDRFRQEARAIAAITHPNVCTLYDIGPNYLVMELIEGETLAARLKRGKLPLAQVLRIGSQIAEALAVAHARGIVHRDLKPGNIMLAKTGVKVLDFGLARSPGDLSLTAPGNIIGTPAYMAPERAGDKVADGRADIYPLGLILAEMATGYLSRLPKGLPPALERVVARCLETDPDDRWQSARDLQWELESIAQIEVENQPRTRSVIPAWAVAVAAIALAGLAAYAVWRSGRQVVLPPPVQLSMLLPDKSQVRSLAVSPDGNFVAVVLVKDGKQQIWLRAMDAPVLTPLEGTDDAGEPFWSPDSRFLGFFADSKLKKIGRTGGPAQTLCDSLGAVGGTWNRQGDILIGALDQVQRVSESGGALTRIPGHHNIAELYPVFLPDGHHYLAIRRAVPGGKEAGLWLESMDGLEARRILPDSSPAQVVDAPRGSRVGAILFERAGALMALPFDEKKLEAAGEPFAIAQPIAAGTNGDWLVSASWNGVVAYVSGHPSSWRYVWRDRQGKDLGTIGNAGGVVMLSPDRKRLAGDPGAAVIEVQDLASGAKRRLTTGAARGNNPVWSPDGRYVVYTGPGGLYRIAIDGGTPPELLLRSKTPVFAKSWSPDGRYLIYARVDPGVGADLFVLPIGQPGAQPMPLWQTPATSGQGEFSPDGHWVAVTSNESGQSEIYVIPFPPNPSGQKWSVSVGGGVQPRWRRDGKELFYISPDWKMMAVDVDMHPAFHSGTPHSLFDTEMLDTGIRNGPMSWDVASDGRRFLIITDKSLETSALNVILNWRVQK